MHYFSIFHGEERKRAPFLRRISLTVTSRQRARPFDQQPNELIYSLNAYE